MEESQEKKVILNDQSLTLQEFEEKKKELLSKKGVKIIEVAAGTYKTQIRG